MKHHCYYCGREITIGIKLVTFYTKECKHCDVSYHIDRGSDVIGLIVLDAIFHDKEYVITHNTSRNKTRISKRREEWIWKTTATGMAAEIFPITIVEFDADYNTINPSNLNERLKTILTFL